MHVPAYLSGKIVGGQRRGLDALQKTLHRLNRIHCHVPTVLVGGTNGKGSTVAFLESMVRSAGYRVGAFFSPSLEVFHDQFRLNGQVPDSDRIHQLVEEVNDAARADPLTLFETATATAYLYFFREQVDLAVVEVGMGGKNDATNVATPCLSILTQVALDHVAELGPNLLDIAEEKVGIVRRFGCLITGAEGAVQQFLEQKCSKLEATIDICQRQFVSRIDGAHLHYASNEHPAFCAQLGLKGRYQEKNAALAVRAVERLSDQGFVISDEAIRSGLASAHLRGRFEVHSSSKIPHLIIDGAHNPHGMFALSESVQELDLPRPRFVVLACFADKDFVNMIHPLLEWADGFLCAHTTERSLEPAFLEEVVKRQTTSRHFIQSVASLDEALSMAFQRGAQTVLATGTLSIVAPMSQALAKL